MKNQDKGIGIKSNLQYHFMVIFLFKSFLILHQLSGNRSIAFFISNSENIDPSFQRRGVNDL